MQQRLNVGSDLLVFLWKAHLLKRGRLSGRRDSEALQLGGEVLIEHLTDLRHPGLHGILEVIQKRLRLAVHFTTTVYPWRIWALIWSPSLLKRRINLGFLLETLTGQRRRRTPLPQLLPGRRWRDRQCAKVGFDLRLVSRQCYQCLGQRTEATLRCSVQ